MLKHSNYQNDTFITFLFVARNTLFAVKSKPLENKDVILECHQRHKKGKLLLLSSKKCIFCGRYLLSRELDLFFKKSLLLFIFTERKVYLPTFYRSKMTLQKQTPNLGTYFIQCKSVIQYQNEITK